MNQKYIQNPVKHLRNLTKIVNGFNLLTIFAKKLHFRCLVGSECDFENDICIVNFPPILHFDKVGLSLILSMFYTLILLATQIQIEMNEQCLRLFDVELYRIQVNSSFTFSEKHKSKITLHCNTLTLI